MKNMTQTKMILLAGIISIVSIFSFNSLHYRAPLFESGIYFGYLQSLIHDQDLNLINNVNPELTWILSPTFNVPVMHDHGISILWLPLGIIGNTADLLLGPVIHSSRGSDSFLLLSVLISTLILVMGGMLLLKKITLPESLSEKAIFWIFPITTPLLFYGFFEFASADIGAFFWSCLILYFGDTFSLEKKKLIFTWGLLFSIGRIIKISFLFWLPYFLYILLSKSASTKKDKIKNLVIFSSGVLIPLILKWTNDFIEFGFLTWNNGYGYDFEFPRPPFFESLYSNLFGNYGMFHIGLWLVFGFSFFLLNMRNSNSSSRRVWQVLAFTIFSKFIYECLCVSDNETEFGFRRYLIDVPFFTWMAVEFVKNSKEKLPRLAAWLSFGILMIWSVWYLFWYQDLDHHYYAALGVYRFWQFGDPIRSMSLFFHAILESFKNKDQILIGLTVFTGSLALFNWRHKFSSSVMARTLPFGFLILYFIMTLLNAIFNPLHTRQLHANQSLETQVISANLSVLLYDEILSEISRSLLIAKYKGDKTKFDNQVELLKDYLGRIPNEIKRDPIHFVDDLKSGKIRKIYYDAEIDMESLTDFNRPSYYDRLMGPYLFKQNSERSE